MKKLLSVAIALAMSLTLLTACGGNGGGEAAPAQNGGDTQETADTGDGGEEAPAASGDEVVLKFSVWDLDTTAFFEPLKDAFEAENPGIKIEFLNTPSAEYTDKLSTMLNGGSDFDVLLVKDSDTSLGLYKKGQLVDLTPYIEADGVDLGAYNGLAEAFNFDGGQAGMPFRTDYYILYYNKDIFDAAGEDYPTNDMTWDDFEEIAARLTTGEGTDKQYGAFIHTWQACVQNWAVQSGENTMMGPDYGFMEETYDRIVRMQANGDIPDFGTLKSAQIHYGSAFQTATAGMMPMGSWFISTMINAVKEGETDVNWGIATIPHPAGMAAGNTVGSSTPIAINAASANPDAAWEFVKFCTSEAGATILAEYGQFAGRSNDDLLEIITNVDGMPEGAAEALQVENIVLDRPIVENVNEVNKMLEEVHGLIMLGESTVAEGLASMEEQSREIQGL